MKAHVVQPGETLDSIAELHGVDPLELAQLNQNALNDHAQARGFTASSFMRLVRDEEGHERHVMGHHVFPGETLHVKETKKEHDTGEGAQPYDPEPI